MKGGDAEGSVGKFERALRAQPGFQQAAVALSVAKDAVAAGRPPAPEETPEIEADKPAAGAGEQQQEKTRPYSPSQWVRDGERAPADFEGYRGKVHPFAYVTAAIRASDLPEGVDPTHREAYLSAKEFVRVFGMPKADFYRLPKWRRNEMKRGRKMF